MSSSNKSGMGDPINREKQQTPTDSGQHGQAQNILDETKDTYGRYPADRNVGNSIDAGKHGGFSSRVDEILNQSGGDTRTTSAQRKAERRTSEGFTVGQEGDQHELAANKQP